MPAYLLEIFSVYNNRGATPATHEAQKVLSHKAFRASFTLAASLYIAAGDAEGGGDLPLRQGDGAPQAVPQADDLGLPVRQALIHQPSEPQGAVPVVEVLQHGVVHAHHVHQLQGVALLVRLDGVGEGDLPLELFLAAEVHEDLVFDAPGGIGGQPGPLLRIKTGDALDQADGADGDQVLLVSALGVVLLHDVGYQPEIPLNEHVPGGLVPLGPPAEIFLLLAGGQGLWKRPAAGQAQGEQQRVGKEQQSGRQHKIPPGHFYAGRGSPHAGGLGGPGRL